MIFIGQERIWRELDFLLPEMIQENRNLNFIIRAPSGWGKTKLAICIANLINPESIDFNIPNREGEIQIDLNKRIIIIDEVHTLQIPELLYPVMDSGNHIFILCSNEFGELKEPLVNRCIDLNFDQYSTEEIMGICESDFINEKLKINQEVLAEISRNSNLNPRVARNITERLIIIFKRSGIPTTTEEVRNILRNVLQIEDGLNPLHRRYLEYLSKVKRASLDSISFATRIDKKTILKEVEPVLIDKNLIFINSKGRNLC